MSRSRRCSNPPALIFSRGADHVKQLGGLSTNVIGPSDSLLAFLLVHVPAVFKYEAPNLRKLANGIAAAGFYVVVPNFLHGDSYDPQNAEKSTRVWSQGLSLNKAYEKLRKTVLEALQAKDVPAVGAVDFCWSAKVVVQLAKVPISLFARVLNPKPYFLAIINLEDKVALWAAGNVRTVVTIP